MKLFGRILNVLGYISISKYRKDLEDINEYLSAEIEELKAKSSILEQPKHSSVPYRMYIPNPESKKSKHAQYWDDVCRNSYSAWYLSIFLRHPDIVHPFLRTFSEFDWKSVEEYMEEVQWFWGDNQCSPTIEDLHSTVLELTQSLLSREKPGFTEPIIGCESGGFIVRITYDKGYHVSITFNK